MIDASLYDESNSPSARSNHLHVQLMDKLNLSDNDSKKKKKSKKQATPPSEELISSGDQDGDDIKSINSSKVSSLAKTKSIMKKKLNPANAVA